MYTSAQREILLHMINGNRVILSEYFHKDVLDVWTGNPDERCLARYQAEEGFALLEQGLVEKEVPDEDINRLLLTPAGRLLAKKFKATKE